MNISNNNTINGTDSLWEQISNQNINPYLNETGLSQEDSIRISNFSHKAVALNDDEVDATLQETVDIIRSDPYSAMYAHSGLDANRVAALLS